MDENAANETVIKDDGSKVIKLDFPIQWGASELIEEVTIKPPRGKHLKGMQVGVALTYDQYMSVISKCSEISMAALDELHATDNVKLIQEVSDFLENGPKIGKK